LAAAASGIAYIEQGQVLGVIETALRAHFARQIES